MEPQGLDFEDARENIIFSINEALSAHKAAVRRDNSWSVIIRESFQSRPLQYILLPSCITIPLCLICAVLVREDTPLQAWGLLATAVLIGLNLVVNVGLYKQKKWIEQNEVTEKVTRILDVYVKNLGISQLVVSAEQARLAQLGGSSGSTDQGDAILACGHPHISIMTVYRNQQWQRVPLLLLCKSDIVALMTGDVAPCRVQEIMLPSINSSNSSGGGGGGGVGLGAAPSSAQSAPGTRPFFSGGISTPTAPANMNSTAGSAACYKFGEVVEEGAKILPLSVPASLPGPGSGPGITPAASGTPTVAGGSSDNLTSNASIKSGQGQGLVAPKPKALARGGLGGSASTNNLLVLDETETEGEGELLAGDIILGAGSSKGRVSGLTPLIVTPAGVNSSSGSLQPTPAPTPKGGDDRDSTAAFTAPPTPAAAQLGAPGVSSNPIPVPATPSGHHRSIASDNAELLSLAGSMRCYALMESPVQSHVAALLQQQQRQQQQMHSDSDSDSVAALPLSTQCWHWAVFMFPWVFSPRSRLQCVFRPRPTVLGSAPAETTLHLLAQRMLTEGLRALCYLSLLHVACSSVRLALIPEASEHPVLALVVPLPALTLIFLPVALPLWLLIVEVTTTARILVSLEAS